jgi:hypothetical protein
MRPDLPGFRTLACGLNTFDQLLDLSFVFFGSEDELHSHAEARMHALYCSLKSQFNLIRPNYQLQFGTAGKSFSAFDVTTTRTDVGQSAASSDAAIRPVKFHPQTTRMTHNITAISRCHRQHAQTSAQPQRGLVVSFGRLQS